MINEEGLRDWFGKSKSKDGKGGWVNVVTGGTCASDKPGEGTPKCVSSAKRASMSKKERLSAQRRKKAADPGQQQKSGAAKPTYVKTDSTRKMKEETVNEATDKKGKGSGSKDACYHKVKSRYSVWPSAYASGALVKCRKVGAANWGNSSKKEEFEGFYDLPAFTESQIAAMKYAGIEVEVLDEKCWKGYEKKGMKTMFGKRYPNCVKKEEVEQIQEKPGDGYLGPTMNVGGRPVGIPNPIRIAQDAHDTTNRTNQKKVDKINQISGRKSSFMPKYNNFNKQNSTASQVMFGFNKEETEVKESHKNPESVKGIAKELDKAVEMHKSQAKRLRKAGVSEEVTGGILVQDAQNFKPREIESVDVIEAEPIKGGQVQEASRVKQQVGNMYQVIFGWRGKMMMVKLFFPDVAVPNRQKVADSLDKMYPGSQLRSYSHSVVDYDDPYINVGESKDVVTKFRMSDNKQSIHEGYSNWREDLSEDMTGMSQKSGDKRSTESGAGMTAKGVAKYNRRTGGNLKTAVTTPPSKLKPGSKAANRRKSFCARSRSWKGERGLAARRRWNC